MREIKFRAWSNTDKKMYYAKFGVGYFETNGEWWQLSTNDKVKARSTQKDILMQYTGLKDRNGKEIYEGDILDFTVFDYNDADTQYRGAVRFAEGEYQIWKSANDEFYGSDGAFHLYEMHCQDCEIEIIGNIYENPELSGGTE